MRHVLLTTVLFLSCFPARAEEGALTYKGYACTKDCSGHRAGYEWAKRKGIADPVECGGKSKSFVEGCRSFTEEAEDTPPEKPEAGSAKK